MSLKSFCVSLTFASTFLFLNTAFGQKATLQADVIGVDGRPSKSAQVRIERQDKKAAPVIVAADKRGHLVAMNLEAGTYKLTATVEGGIKSSQTVKVQANKPATIAFDLSKSSAVTSKKKKKYIWVPSETGSNLGGRWVETGEDANSTSSGQNVDKMSGEAMSRQMRTGVGGAPRASGGQ